MIEKRQVCKIFRLRFVPLAQKGKVITMKKWMVGIAAASVTLAMLAGCAGGGNGKSGEERQVNEEYAHLRASDKPLEMTIFQFSTQAFDDEYPVFLKAAEMTNVSLKRYLAKSVSEVNQAFNLMMGSGEIADIVCYSSKSAFFKYGSEGAFLPLNDLIREYAPHIQAFLDENPETRRYITAMDGNIYYIPYIADGEVSQCWYMRQDWLDKLNLERPRTTEEFYQVLKAFREQDPNGNGQQDEIPLFSNGAKTSFNTMLPLWGANCWWYADDAGKIHFGPAEENYKQAHIDLAKWYREGLIDREIYTRGSNSMSTLLSANQGGCTHAWAGSTATYNDVLKEDISGFDWRPVAPPGEKGSEARATVSEAGWAISHSNKNPEAAMKYFDFWFTEEGRRLANFGIEGKQYEMVDGKPIFKDEVLNSDEAVVTQLNKIGAQLRIGVWQDFAYEKQWLNPIALEGIEEYVENGYCLKPAPTFLRTEEEEREYSDLQGVITSYVEEYSQKWVMGQSDPAQEFDAYLARLKNLKLDRLMEIQQAAYERYMAQ